MKVFLDDIRTPSDYDWIWTKTAQETIERLKEYNVTELSLDHDLAFEHYAGNYQTEQTGYHVLLWIEEQVVTNNYNPPKIYLHTANPSAKMKMQACLNNIMRIVNEREPKE